MTMTTEDLLRRIVEGDSDSSRLASELLARREKKSFMEEWGFPCLVTVVTSVLLILVIVSTDIRVRMFVEDIGLVFR